MRLKVKGLLKVNNNLSASAATLSQANRRNAYLWLLVLLVLSLIIGWKITGNSPFYSDITELLPHSEQQPEIVALETQMQHQFSRQLLLLLRVRDDDRSDNNTDAHSLRLSQKLKQKLLQSPYINDALHTNNLQSQLRQLFQPYRNQLLTPQQRLQLQQTSATDLASRAAESLFNPAADPRPYAFVEDPFNLGGQWLQAQQANTRIRLHNGWPVISAAGGNWYLISLAVNVSSFNLAMQESILPLIDNFEQQMLSNDHSVELLKSGLIFHAAAGAQLAKNEISTVGLGSLLAIVILVVTVFRSGLPLLAVLIALSSGLIVALSVSLLVFERIHLLTLAFGSTLLGVAVDYCFHFMLNSQQLGCSQQCRKLLGPALATGALSSIAAYLLQLVTPFPGLQQMAVFSAAGLAGTWLAVIAFGPLYRPNHSNTIVGCGQFFECYIRPLYGRLRSQHRIYIGLNCGLFVVSAVILQTQPGNNDVRTLNTSGTALLDQSRRVQELLQPSSSSRFFVVSGSDQEQLLIRLEKLQQALQPLHKRGFVETSQSLAKWSPSQQQQQSDFELIQHKLYQQALPELCQLLQIIDCSALHQSASSTFKTGLTPSRVKSLSAVTGLLPVKQQQYFHATTILTLNPLATDVDLIDIAEPLVGIRFVNRISDMSQLLVNYRQTVGLYLAAALTLIATVLLYRYRLCGLRILAPMTLSALVGLAVAAYCSGLTVFHLLAVLLVVGISLDTGIFYREMGLNGDSWLAATLSAFTSVLAFGLLSLSQVAVLHQFGIVVLSGMLCCWLITPIFFIAREDTGQTSGLQT
jgi:predicted exporter